MVPYPLVSGRRCYHQLCPCYNGYGWYCVACSGRSYAHYRGTWHSGPSWRTRLTCFQQAERLRTRLQLAAHEAGLSNRARSAGLLSESKLEEQVSEPLKRVNGPMSLYETLLGADFSPSVKRTPSTQDPLATSPPRTIPSTPPRRVPTTPPSGTVRTPSTSERLTRLASAPQMGSPHHTHPHMSDLHNHPTPDLLRREQQGVLADSYGMSPKRRRVGPAASNPPFRFPASPHRLPNGHVASSLAQGLGLTQRMTGPPQASSAPISSSGVRYGHSRIASMPEWPNDTFVPVRGHDPVSRPSANAVWSHTPGADAMVSPHRGSAYAAGRSLHQPASHLRTNPAHTRAEKRVGHQRSMSQGTAGLGTSMRFLHDRSSSITTPPAAPPSQPVTPKTMHPHMSYGEYLNMSPSPQPRSQTRPRRGMAAENVLRSPTRTPTSTSKRSMPPLWAQPSQRS